MIYHIHYCNDCETKCELSVVGDVWCPCGRKMEKIGELDEKD